jgi:isopentenyl-diphosphate delta-isomerase
MEEVVLVDEGDNQVGVMEKLQAHREGRLHRAISVFIFNSNGEMLLQQRAAGKYHSAGLWTNACCSHPRVGEAIEDAAQRRLQEEMGMKCALKEIFTFIYKAQLANQLTEYEYDHVFTGISNSTPVPDAAEVSAWKYIAVAKLVEDVAANPDQYTEWFKICLHDWQKELIG